MGVDLWLREKDQLLFRKASNLVLIPYPQDASILYGNSRDENILHDLRKLFVLGKIVELDRNGADFVLIKNHKGFGRDFRFGQDLEGRPQKRELTRGEDRYPEALPLRQGETLPQRALSSYGFHNLPSYGDVRPFMVYRVGRVIVPAFFKK